MKVLYSHHGMKGKNGWGRTFYMAQGLADLGHDVTLLTINPKCSFFKINTIIYQGVKNKSTTRLFSCQNEILRFCYLEYFIWIDILDVP